MTTSITIKPDDDGAYHLDVEVEGQKKSVLIDTGFTGKDGPRMFVNKANWDKIKDKLTEKGKTTLGEDAQGNPISGEHGKGKIKVPGLGLEVEKLIAMAPTITDELVGSLFLRNLIHCTATIDCTSGEMVIKYDPPPPPAPPPGPSKSHLIKPWKEKSEKNKIFYEQSKGWLDQNYRGRYLIIGNGALLDVQDTYDTAISKSSDYEAEGMVTLVYRAGETPVFGTVKLSSPRPLD